MGRSGSGKTTLSRMLLNIIPSCSHINADAVRTEYNDWDFSIEGRMRQAERMHDKAQQQFQWVDTVIIDMICPLKEMRKIIKPDIIIYMEREGNKKFKNTDEIFEEPDASEAEQLYNIL